MDDQRDLERMLGNLRKFQSESDASKESEKSPSNAGAGFDTDEFLAGLDAMFAAHTAKDKADGYLQQAMADAENAQDYAGLLTVLNETMGFYRSQGRHQENQWIIQRAIELALRMGLEGTGMDHHAHQRGHIATGRRQSRPRPRICSNRHSMRHAAPTGRTIAVWPPSTTTGRCCSARRIAGSRHSTSCTNR